MKHVTTVPVLAFVLAVYIVIAAVGGPLLDGDLLTIGLPSGAEMTMRGADLLVLAGLAALTADLAKIAGTGALGHVLRAVMFVAALACFLLLGLSGTMSFLLLGAMTLVEVIAGAAILRRPR